MMESRTHIMIRQTGGGRKTCSVLVTFFCAVLISYKHCARISFFSFSFL